ncbi:MAG: aromatic ring-hydroxylating dioxygenase subunit alpha [Rhodobacteraceae bacterium]|nr:MAG: aromatic ring-hydroxylating dioxygenase subunit alpha [Paracoccaceae bacterium]
MLDRDAVHTLRAGAQRDYTDPAVLAREQEALFDRDWVMVTRAGAAPNPGDYVAAKLGERPIAVVRQKDGTLRAFANFCLHRYVKLLEGSGNARRIVCPYHAWTYDISGQLIGVADREGFCNVDTRDMALEELACDVWEGFVFVSRRLDLAPVSQRLSKLSDYLAHYAVGSYEDRHFVETEIWEGNWKAVVENFIESYHTTYSHKGSIGPTNPTKLAEPGHAHEGFSIHSNSYAPEHLPEVHNAAIDADERRQFHVVSLYPNGVAAIDPNFMWWMAMEPLGPGRTNARWGVSFSPAAMAGMADPEKFVADIVRVLEIATEEDQEMVRRVQEGAAFGSDRRGYLHDWLEIYVDEFRRYVDGMIGRA